MALTKRTLTNWRRDALKANAELIAKKKGIVYSEDHRLENFITNDRILIMTQKLLDQIMLKEANKDV